MTGLRTFAALSAAIFLAAGCQASTQDAKFKLQGRLITVKTAPEGARVWQIAQPSGSRVDLGMTPLVNQTVMVLTQYKGTFGSLDAAQSMMSEVNSARLRIEKPGYQPYDLLITTDPRQTVERLVTLEPATEPPPPPATQPVTAAAAGSP